MAVAPIIDESPSGHADELRMLRTPNPPVIQRVIDIASVYADGVSSELECTREACELLYELKSAAERFDLWDDLVVRRAARALMDPMGW